MSDYSHLFGYWSNIKYSQNTLVLMLEIWCFLSLYRTSTVKYTIKCITLCLQPCWMYIIPFVEHTFGIGTSRLRIISLCRSRSLNTDKHFKYKLLKYLWTFGITLNNRIVIKFHNCIFKVFYLLFTLYFFKTQLELIFCWTRIPKIKTQHQSLC